MCVCSLQYHIVLYIYVYMYVKLNLQQNVYISMQAIG